MNKYMAFFNYFKSHNFFLNLFFLIAFILLSLIGFIFYLIFEDNFGIFSGLIFGYVIFSAGIYLFFFFLHTIEDLIDLNKEKNVNFIKNNI